MIDSLKPVVLCVDDDEDLLYLLRSYLESSYYVIIARDGSKALDQVLTRRKPDLILLDIMMPDIDGFAVCDRLQQQTETASIPILLMSSMDKNITIGRAYEAGAVGYLVKPFNKEKVLELVAKHIETPLYMHRKSTVPASQKAGTRKLGFLSFFANYAGATNEHKRILENSAIGDIYYTSNKLGLKSSLVARALADYTGLPYMPLLNPALARLQDAHTTQEHLVLHDPETGSKVLVVSNPLVGSVAESSYTKKAIATPENLARLHELDDISYLCERIMLLTREQQVTVIIEPHGECYSIRLLSETGTETAPSLTLDGDTAKRLVLAFRKLAGLPAPQSDLPEKATFALNIAGKVGGYALVVNPSERDRLEIKHISHITVSVSFQERALSAEHDRLLQHYAKETAGLILIIGPDHSGKSVTVSNILQHAKGRDIITVENTAKFPLEYANRLLVDEATGDTFERLLKAAISQQPDIVYADNLDSYYSARILTEYVQQGNLAIVRLNADTPAAAIKALEKLGLRRLDIANNVICIVHQITTRKLCSDCKQVHLPTEAEISNLSRYVSSLPEKTATSSECSKCDYTGFKGKQRLLEVIAVDRDIRRQIHSHGMERYDSCLATQALTSIANFTVTISDACQDILGKLGGSGAMDSELTKLPRPKTVLVVDDDEDHSNLLRRYLLNSGYGVICAKDGVEALLFLKKKRVDLMLVDIQMPAMDGFTLAETSREAGMEIPIIFVSVKNSEYAVIKGLKSGAVDYVLKPVKKEVLLEKVAAILKPSTRQDNSVSVP